MKKSVYSLIIMLLLASISQAGELNMLLDSLVEKNLLSPAEAQEIKIGTQEEVKKEISQQRHSTLPMWIQTIKLKGDVRIRYQYNDNDNIQYKQNRLRYRLRFFVDGKVNEKVYTGFGLASGNNSDPRSTNQTFSDNFAKKSIYLDYVFMEYNHSDYLSFTAGRNKNPLWLTNDMLFDSDINPEGVNIKISKPFNDAIEFCANGGYFVLGESVSDPKDPGLFFIQPALKWENNKNTWDIKTGIGFYEFMHIKNKNAFGNRPSATDYHQANTLILGKYKYNYKIFSPELELNAKLENPLILPLLNYLGYTINYIGIYGNYTQNTAISKYNKAWIAGIKIGQNKVEDTGQWQLGFNTRRMDKNAWLDTYPDSDFYGGATDVKGEKYQLSVGLLKDFAINMYLNYSSPIINAAKKKEKIFQTDVNLRF